MVSHYLIGDIFIPLVRANMSFYEGDRLEFILDLGCATNAEIV